MRVSRSCELTIVGVKTMQDPPAHNESSSDNMPINNLRSIDF